VSAAVDAQLARRCSVLECAGLVFLATPLLLFFATFMTYPLAAVGIPVIVTVLWRRRPERPWRIGLTWREVLLCVALAVLFLWVCGYLSPFDRAGDWAKHFAIVNKLRDQSWPPVDESTDTFLRFYLGYYLVPGLAAKLFGSRFSYLFMLAQTWLGLTIVLALLVEKLRPLRPLAFLVVFLLFGGLDVIGYYLFAKDPVLLGHKEWWSGTFSYQGHMSQFVWAPQHVLSALLGLALVLPAGGRGLPMHALALLFSALAFWSPFTALGLAPIALAATWGTWKDALTDWGNVACGLAVGVPTIAYLLAGSSDIPFDLNTQSLKRHFAFVMLEFGFLVAALYLCDRQWPRYALVVIAWLVLLPLFRIGMFNDLNMRASIPALALIAMAAASTLTETRSWRVVPLAILLLIGATGSVLESIAMSRKYHMDPQTSNMQHGVFVAKPELASQYRAPLPHWTIRH
jgi:hypothetical protein